jgi:hypothetical protein
MAKAEKKLWHFGYPLNSGGELKDRTIRANTNNLEIVVAHQDPYNISIPDYASTYSLKLELMSLEMVMEWGY